MKKRYWFLLFTVALLVLLACAVGYFAARVFSIDPGLAVRDLVTGYQRGAERHKNAQPLPQPWDPIGDSNRLIEGIPVEDRSYPLLAEANAVFEAAGAADLVKLRPSDQDWGDTVAWLESDEGRRVSALVGQAVARPHAGFPLGDGSDPVWEAARERVGLEPHKEDASDHPTLIDVYMPVVGAKRRFSRHLAAEARLAIFRRDQARFEQATQTIAGLSRHTYASYSLLEHLIDLVSLNDLCDVVTEAMAADGMLTEQLVASADTAIDRFDPLEQLAEGFEAERVLFEDQIRRMVNEKGVFVRSKAMQVMFGTDTRQLNIEPSSVAHEAINEGLARALDEHQESLAAAQRSASVPLVPYGDFDAQVETWKRGTADSIPGRTGKLMLGMFVPAITKVATTTRTTHQRQIAVRLALAAHRHRLRHGDPPLGLADIDDDLITFDPIDGFTGGPMQFRWRDGAPFVYTYGPEKDDDGGRHVLDDDGEPWLTISDELLESAPDGDFVLFPAQKPTSEDD